MIKVHDIAFGRLQSPDLDQAEEFLTDYGKMIASFEGPSLIKKFIQRKTQTR